MEKALKIPTQTFFASFQNLTWTSRDFHFPLLPMRFLARKDCEKRLLRLIGDRRDWIQFPNFASSHEGFNYWSTQKPSKSPSNYHSILLDKLLCYQPPAFLFLVSPSPNLVRRTRMRSRKSGTSCHNSMRLDTNFFLRIFP